MRWIALTVLLMTTVGCTSFTSTGLKRFDDNAYAGLSNGRARKHGKARPYKGVPITLKVPTHVDVFIDETYFIHMKHGSATELLDGQTRILNVRTEVIKSDKVFMVDFKRPASGTLDLNLTFDEEEQYFKQIVSQLEDTTITDTAALVGSVIGAAKKFAGESAEVDVAALLENTPNVTSDIRTVAFQRFDLGSPTFEFDMECFVNKHLNDCHTCDTSATYDN